jgi:hypothetical protein
MKHQDACPEKAPAQLSACKDTITCPYDKKCCPRCAGQKQVCGETQAECDGMSWELRTSALVCPDCEDYYYDDMPEGAPTEPQNITATMVTQTSATLIWKTPEKNFKAGVDGYSVAYAEDKLNDADEKVTIMDTTTSARAALANLVAGTVYKVSILPIINATEIVGAAGTLEFKTLPAAGKGKAKGKAGKATGKVTPPAAGKAKAGRR